MPKPIDYADIASYDDVPEPGSLGNAVSAGGAGGQPAPMLSQPYHVNRRAFVAGAMDSLPSFDALRQPRFPSNPDFNPYVAALKRGNAGDIDVLRGAGSQEEFDWIANRLDADRAAYSRDIGASPAAAVIGAFVGEQLTSPSNLVPLARPVSLAAVGSNVLRVGSVAAVEESVKAGLSSERGMEHAVLNAVAGTAGVAVLSGALYTGGRIWRGVRRDPLADLADMRAGRDPAPPSGDRDPLSAEGRSMGAAGTGQMKTAAERVWANQMADALGAEHIPDIVTPLSRVMGNPGVPEVSELAELLIESPFMLNKNRAGEASGVSVENTLRRVWRPVHGEWRRDLDTHYLEWLKEVGGRPMAGSALLSDVNARIRGGTHSQRAFLRDVWEDMARGHADSVDWTPPAAVREASLKTRGVYDRIVKEAIDLDLHIRDLQADLQRATDPAEITRIKAEMDARTQAIQKNQNSYVNVIFDKEAIRARPEEFLSFVMAHTRVGRPEALKVMETVLNQQPFKHLTEKNRVGTARSMHQRELVDDPLAWADWLNTDALEAGTLYIRTMTPDIELARAFGVPDMADQIGDIRTAFDAKIQAAATPAEAKALAKQRDERIEDLMAVRDMIRGTYMIPPDPEHPVARGIRMAKNWNAATMLTGALAAVPDVARVVTANGLLRSMGSLFEALRKPDLYRMAKGEARAVGEAWDIVLGTRAAVFSDIGEAVGAFSKMERLSAEVGQHTFNINLMNFWNEAVKSASSLVVSTKILGDVEALVAGKATPRQVARLAASGIDDHMAQRIAAEGPQWHRTDHNIIAQASTWKDQVAADAFRAALSRELNIVVLTPGIGERPLWMSQTLDKTIGYGKAATTAQLDEIARLRRTGASQADIDAYVAAEGIGKAPAWLSQNYLSLVAQFKSFMISSVYRTMIPALQERDMNVAAMLAIATGMGLVIENVRASQGDYAAPDNAFDAIMAGVDRAGLAGWYLEPNNIIERASGNTLGLRPLLGNRRQYDPSLKTYAAILGGPTGSQAATIAGIVGDLATGGYDRYTAKAIRKVMPWQNVAHVDWLYDQIEAGLRSMQPVREPGAATR